MRSERLLLTLSIALVIPALGACRGILGLDEFRKVECPGAVCSDDGGTVVEAGRTDAEAGTDSGGGDSGKGADPVSWARWKMPNYVDDAGLPNPPIYPGPVDDEVEDGVTGLVWKSKTQPALATRADAEVACRALGDWRLPKRIELVTLLDYGGDELFVNTVKFPGVKNGPIWTSSEVRPFTGAPDQKYWTVDFGTGQVGTLRGDFNGSVLCVKAKGT